MKKANFALAVALLVCAPCLSFAQQIAGAEEAAIRQVVQHYFNGIIHNDAESLRHAVHLRGKWFFQSNTNELMEVSQQRIYNNVRDNARRGISRQPAALRIVSIDITNRVAAVKIAIDFPDAYLGGDDLRTAPPGIRQIDYLSLIRFDEGWKIVGKVSTLERIAETAQSAAR